MLEVPEFRFRDINAINRTADPARLLPHDAISNKTGLTGH
jgi:hypothetical protein